jgi:hypothetical protein
VVFSGTLSHVAVGNAYNTKGRTILKGKYTKLVELCCVLVFGRFLKKEIMIKIKTITIFLIGKNVIASQNLPNPYQFNKVQTTHLIFLALLSQIYNFASMIKKSIIANNDVVVVMAIKNEDN